MLTIATQVILQTQRFLGGVRLADNGPGPNEHWEDFLEAPV